MKFNAAFWKWFGNSVVRHPDGTPMVVYHGTPEQFYEFKHSRSRKHRGAFFFTADEEFAKQFIQGADDTWDEYLGEKLDDENIGLEGDDEDGWTVWHDDAIVGDGYKSRKEAREAMLAYMTEEGMIPPPGHVMAVYLRLENPYDPRKSDHQNALLQFIASKPELQTKISRNIGSNIGRLVKTGDWGILEMPEVKKWLVANKFDGYFCSEKSIEGVSQIDTIAVYTPTQIKSVDNAGTWKRSDPDIRRNPRRRR